uniref:C-type lectin domain-containing protein n=1 Tax=Pygocentrus nattereri TaxID=42514 RepID=A0A3B4CL23_PYGNA
MLCGIGGSFGQSYYRHYTDLILNYHLILDPMSWYEAQRYCRKSYTDLVSIRDQNQNEAVKTSAMTRNTSFWIGLLCDDWEWTDGGRSAYRNWATGQPEVNLNCTVLTNSIDHDGKWYSVACDPSYLNNTFLRTQGATNYWTGL